MKEYRYVMQFYYKGNLYNMYLDNHNKHFFLKNNEDGNLSYVTIEELLELSLCLTDIPSIMNVKKDQKKMKLIPKILIGGTSVTLGAAVLGTIISLNQSLERNREFLNNYKSNQQGIEKQLDNYISYDNSTSQEGTLNEETSQEDLVVDTYLESDWLHYLYIYDMDYLDKALDYKNVSIDQIKEVISNNSSISDKFKNLMYEYCDALNEKYPDTELRVLYENAKTLEIVECSKEELVAKSLSMDSYATYIRTENKIYVLDNFEYEKGTWAYQVLFHEIGHCLRTAVWNKDGVEVRVQIEGQNFSNTITAEALNSLFTVSLFDYEERNVAYQLQSNYHDIMIECMDNYSLADYPKHSISYYAKKLDEFNQDDNYATVILELIQMQYKDYHSDLVKADPSEYNAIYDYVSDMYYKKYLTPNMSYSEAVDLTNQLVERVTYDVPEDYNIDVNHFYDHLNSYCNNIGIDTNKKAKK